METQLRNHQEVLRTMYVTQNQTLEAVMHYMEENHHVAPRKSVYTRLFRKWNIQKNKKSKDWKFVDRHLKKRKNEGKESHVFHNGMLLPEQKLRKEVSRNVSPLQQLNYDAGDSPRLPHGYQVVTPSTQPPVRLSLATLPILHFQEHIQETPVATSGEVFSMELNAMTRLTGHENHEQFFSFLSAVLPIEALMEEVTALELIITREHGPSFAKFLNLTTFLISNNLVDGPIGENLYRWIMQHGGTNFLHRFLSIGSLTSKAFIENVFRLAVEAGDTPTVQYLMRNEVCAQGHKCKHMDIPDFLSPLQFACVSGNSEMAQVLIDFGVQIDEPTAGWKRSLIVLAIIGHFRMNTECKSGNIMYNNDDDPSREESSEAGVEKLYELVQRLIKKGARLNPNAVHEQETYTSAAEVEWRDMEEEIEGLPIAFLEGHSPLTAASKYHCQRLVDLFILRKVDVNYVTKRRTSAIQECLYSWEEMWSCVKYNGSPGSLTGAISQQSTAIVRLLLDNEADVNCCAFYVFPSQFGGYPDYYSLFSALDLAITAGVFEHVRILFDKGVSVTDNCWPCATLSESFEIFEFLLLNVKLPTTRAVVSAAIELDTREKELVDEELFEGEMLEERDTKYPLNRWMETLLRHRPDDHTKKISIIEATVAGEMSIWKEELDSESLDLIQLFQDPEEMREAIRNCCRGGLTKLLAQILKSNVNVPRCILHHTLYWTVKASCNEEIELIELLLRRGANVWPIHGPQSPLLEAIMRRQKTICKMIIAELPRTFRESPCCGYNYPHSDGEWAPTWMAAIKWGESEVLGLLAGYYLAASTSLPLTSAVQIDSIYMDNGTNPDTFSPRGTDVTPLQSALSCTNLQFDTFSPYGTDVTPLQLALSSYNLPLVKTLLKNGANPNTISSNMEPTALQFAAIGGFLGLAIPLLENGAEVDAPSATQNGRTALEGAAEHGRIDMVKLLLISSETGAANTNLRSAMDLALQNGHHATGELLEVYATLGEGGAGGRQQS